MTKEDDPLERLELDKNSIDREKLAEALEEYIGIDKETADPVFRAKYGSLSDKQKIVAYLLYRKAVVALGKEPEDEEGVESRQISDQTGVNYNTARGTLSREDYIENDKENGGYLIPGYSMNDAIEVLPNGE